MEQSKVKARRRNRSQEAPLVDDRFRADTDDGEPASRAQLLVSAAPLAFDSVPPYLGSAEPSNELDPHTPRSSGVAVISAATISSIPGSSPSSSIAPASTAPAASEAPRARRRGWLLITPAILLGVASVVLALKVVLAPSAPAPQPTAQAPAQVVREAADSPAPAADRAPEAPTQPAVQAAPAKNDGDDGIEIIDTPQALPNKPTTSQRYQPAPRPRSPAPGGDVVKREPASPVIF